MSPATSPPDHRAKQLGRAGHLAQVAAVEAELATILQRLALDDDPRLAGWAERLLRGDRTGGEIDQK